MAANFYEDPKSSLAFLFNPSVALPETDFTAAAAAIGGGMPGSMFAQNNQLRLRDSERINRLQIGQNLLQPYLNRESAQAMQSQQIAAQAASDAMRESGAMSRLNAEQAGALQRALISGNQQAAHDLLQESGANTRQAALLSANLQEATMRNQAGILQSLLGYAGAQGRSGGGGGGAGGGRVGPGGGIDRVAEPGGPLGPTYYPGNFSASLPQVRPMSGYQAPANTSGGGVGGSIPGLSNTITNLLRNYGLN